MINEQFGTSAIGTPLNWSVFLPNTALFPPPWNVVCLWHGGGWSTGSRSWEFPSANDFAAAGIAAVSCDYEMTIDFLAGQNQIVSWPDQYPDCVLAVLAARDPATFSALFGKVTGKVGAYGGSAGATLAMDTALRGTVGVDRVDVCCALSANYDFSDQDSLDQYETQGTWLDQVLLYNNVPDRTFTEQLYNQSILPLALAADPADIPPLFMVQADAEAIGPPTSQMAQMAAALDTIGFTNYVAALVVGQGHAKDNWPKVNPLTGNIIRDDVINFFKTAFLEDSGEAGPTSGFRLILEGGPYTLVGAFTGGVYPEDVRSAVITDLQGAADPGRLYSAELVHFNPQGESLPSLYDFRVIAEEMKGIPFGAYKLLSSPGNDFWTDFLDDEPTLDWSWIIGYRGRAGINQVIPGGVYDFSGPDSAIAACATAGKKLGWGVATGTSTTDEWYDEGGPTEVSKIAIDPLYISPQAYQPVFWDPQHLAKVQDLVTYMGIQYDTNPAVSYIVVSHFMWGFQGFVSGTALDDAKWEAAAADFGYGSKEVAYIFAAKTIIGYFMTAFPNTQLFFSQGRPFFQYNGDGNELTDWIINETNHKCGLMITGSQAVEPPHDPPTIPTFPKGGQAISASNDTNRFYNIAPVPYPTAPQLVDDLMKHAATQGRSFLEIYALDTDNPVNEDVITENNILLEGVVPEF